MYFIALNMLLEQKLFIFFDNKLDIDACTMIVIIFPVSSLLLAETIRSTIDIRFVDYEMGHQ